MEHTFTADQIANACADASLSDAQCESLLIALHYTPAAAPPTPPQEAAARDERAVAWLHQLPPGSFFGDTEHSRSRQVLLTEDEAVMERESLGGTITPLCAALAAPAAQVGAPEGFVMVKDGEGAALRILREALSFYADGSHFHMHQPDAWDTVSGEPTNFYEDEHNTATVEDGSVAKKALEDTFMAGTRFSFDEDDDSAPAPVLPAAGGDAAPAEAINLIVRDVCELDGDYTDEV